MKARACVVAILSGLTSLVASTAVCEERAHAVVQIVRRLSVIQTQMAQGDEAAHTSHRPLLATIGRTLMDGDQAVWKDERNVHAAVAYVLGGGDPRVLTKLRGDAQKGDRDLVGGAIAYGEGRMTEALELLGGIDARSLEPVLAGHLSLVQADLAQASDPAKAMMHLDEARLFAPGTLVEEVALRRQIAVAADIGDGSKLATLASQYLRRFAASVYAGTFRGQLAMALARQPAQAGANILAGLRRELDGLDKGLRRDLYLSVARESAARGKAAMARYAAHEAAALADKGSVESERAKVYEGAALIVSNEFESGLSALETANRGKLDQEDLLLLDTALSVAHRIRPPSLGSDMVTLERFSSALAKFEMEPGGAPAVVQLARSRIASLDKILGEAMQ